MTELSNASHPAGPPTRAPRAVHLVENHRNSRMTIMSVSPANDEARTLMHEMKLEIAALYPESVIITEIDQGAFEKAGGYFFADVNLAAQHVADCGEQFFAARFFHDVTASAGAQGAFGVELLIMHREDEYGESGMERENVFDKIEAAAAGHGDVAEHQVGTFLRQCGQGLFGGACFPTGADIGLDSQELGNAGAGHRMIVHNENVFAGDCCSI